MRNRDLSGDNFGNLKTIYQEDRLVQMLFNALKKCRVSQAETTIDFFEKALQKEDATITRNEIIRALKKIVAETGCGKFITGRRGAHSRIEWRADIRKMAYKICEANNNSASTENDKKTRLTAPLKHWFQLRPEYKVQLELPVDLSHHEAARLVTFIKSLPFSSKESPND